MPNQPEKKVNLRIHYSRIGQPKEYPIRFKVPQDKRDWTVAYPLYDPPYYVDPEVLANNKLINPKGWAQPEEISFPRPLNPIGRTGIAGRGLLGRWGPNFAADPLIVFEEDPGKYKMLAIKRKDSGEWAMPGGMIDENEPVDHALERELKEETGVKLSMKDAVEIYRGFADDPRSTDNAWTNSTVKLLLIPRESALKLKIKAGDDAIDVKWMELAPDNIKHLYSSHSEIAQMALDYLAESYLCLHRKKL